MYDISGISTAFPNLKALVPLAGISGQKDVFKAELDKQPVALKIIKKNDENDAELEREMAAVQLLQVGYIPQVYDYGAAQICGEERYYVIEQFIEGSTLRDVLARNPIQSLDFVLSIAEKLLVACVEFEEKNLVHRDIKPANLILDHSNSLWVIDFGIVRLLDRESRTATSRRFGRFTPGYGAPEQMKNFKAEINSRADLFSIGVILDEALRGYNYFWLSAQNILDVINRVQTIDIPRLTKQQLPNAQLSEFISSLVARYPSRRPQTALEATEWFHAVVRNSRTT